MTALAQHQPADFGHPAGALATAALADTHRPLQLVEPRAAVTVTARVTVDRPKEILGTSGAVEALRRFTDMAAATPWVVLLTGESGTGKGLAAEIIHEKSQRRGRPLVVVNCAAIPSEMAEAELFGYRRGSFTGATSDHAGYFEQADGGTLFLDELGTLSLDLQAKLLRAIETGNIRRIGAPSETKVDVRIIAATSSDLDRMMAERSFRPDLFYRVSKLQFRVPALRERPEDIPVLAGHLAQKAAADLRTGQIEIDGEALSALCRYPWAGNIRDLDNHVSAIVAAAHFEARPGIAAADVHEHMRSCGVRPAAAPAAPAAARQDEHPYDFEDDCHETLQLAGEEKLNHLLARVEYAALTETIRACGNNKTQAAGKLGIHRNSITDRLRALESVIGDTEARPVRIML